MMDVRKQLERRWPFAAVHEGPSRTRRRQGEEWAIRFGLITGYVWEASGRWKWACSGGAGEVDTLSKACDEVEFHARDRLLTHPLVASYLADHLAGTAHELGDPEGSEA